MWPAIFAAGGTVIVGLLGFLGAWLTRRAQREDTNVKNWSELVEANQAERREMREERKEMRTQLADQNVRIAGQDEKIREQDVRLGEIEAQLAASQTLLSSAISFIRHLLSFIAENLPDRPPPSVPISIEEELRRLERDAR